MSRSYKKKPVVKDNNKGEKRFANKKVRRTKNLPNGKAFKKCYQQYDICDWKFTSSYEEFLFYRGLEDNKESYKEWYILYKAK